MCASARRRIIAPEAGGCQSERVRSAGPGEGAPVNIGEDEHKEVIRIEPIPETVPVQEPAPVPEREPEKVPS